MKVWWGFNDHIFYPTCQIAKVRSKFTCHLEIRDTFKVYDRGLLMTVGKNLIHFYFVKNVCMCLTSLF